VGAVVGQSELFTQRNNPPAQGTAEQDTLVVGVMFVFSGHVGWTVELVAQQ
jgi:hypothetical protein